MSIFRNRLDIRKLSKSTGEPKGSHRLSNELGVKCFSADDAHYKNCVAESQRYTMYDISKSQTQSCNRDNQPFWASHRHNTTSTYLRCVIKCMFFIIVCATEPGWSQGMCHPICPNLQNIYNVKLGQVRNAICSLQMILTKKTYRYYRILHTWCMNNLHVP